MAKPPAPGPHDDEDAPAFDLSGPAGGGMPPVDDERGFFAEQPPKAGALKKRAAIGDVATFVGE